MLTASSKSRKPQSRGQISIEYIVTLALISMIFVVSVSAIMNGKKTQNQVIWSQDGKNKAEKIAQTINKAYIGGDGFETDISLGKKLLGGVNYTITVRPRLVSVSVPSYGREFEWKFQNADVDGAADGLNLNPGRLRFLNSGGRIIITPYDD